MQGLTFQGRPLLHIWAGFGALARLRGNLLGLISSHSVKQDSPNKLGSRQTSTTSQTVHSVTFTTGKTSTYVVAFSAFGCQCALCHVCTFANSQVRAVDGGCIGVITVGG